MAAEVATRRRPARASITPQRWLRENLFSSAWNTLLTVMTTALIALVVVPVVRWAIIEADWTVVITNRKLLILGRFPLDEMWRLWPTVWLSGLLAGLSTGLWARPGRREVVAGVVVLAFVFGILAHGEPALRLALAVALGVGGHFLSRRAGGEERQRGLLVRATVTGWGLLIPLTLALLLLGEPVRTSLWGGLMLNLVLAGVGIAGAFPVGVLFALGRTSSLPVVRIVSIAYIELVRGAPLLAWLLMARFLLPSFLPTTFGIDNMDIVFRAMLVYIFFTAAYIAEIVRGGLQSLPRGQIEAAQALGLSPLQTTWLIVLPQALRAVIPALVSQFITLYKDTSLVFILSLIDLLGAAQAATEQREFFGRQREALLFAAAVFWAGAFAMSRLSFRIEQRLGIGRR